MKWVINGPDLPDELLQFLEDGRLVLFCGAGTSYPAGLPDFKRLVELVYEREHETPRELEKEEFTHNHFDRVLALLEQRIGCQRVRRAVVNILQLDESANLDTHRSLLRLATDSDGVCRLVTTNFDRGFELANVGDAPIDTAPKLPVPKLGTWNSIVHLHGRISEEDPTGRSLVLTSADFGSAYLTERWASRFLTELFKRFAVLFIGYSVQDPVVRYMMDAFAADRALGDNVGGAYVLAGCVPENSLEKRAWEAKGLIPILYDNCDNHAALHQTLTKWADCHYRGLLGRESIVQEHGIKRPTKFGDPDPINSQVVWALREPTSRVATVFARQHPAPPVEWLQVLETEGLLFLPCEKRGGDAGGWRVPVVDSGQRTDSPPPINPVTRALTEWLARHLDKREVLHWALRSGSVLHREFRSVLRHHLQSATIANPALRRIWAMLADDAPIVARQTPHSCLELHKPIFSGEWDLHLKRSLVEAFTPGLSIEVPVLHDLFEEGAESDSLHRYIDASVVLRCGDNARLLFDAINSADSRELVLSNFANESTSLLNSAMELYELVDMAGVQFDPSRSGQPSVSKHEQNRLLHSWTVLLELCRDGLMALCSNNLPNARRLAEHWRSLRYPVFRRLCYFAMTECTLLSPSECISYALENDGWWLWSIYVYREKFRLIVTLWPQLGEIDARRLVDCILAGPPRPMFRESLDDNEFQRIADHEVWVHLAKLGRTGRALPQNGCVRLSALSDSHPEWKLRDDDRDEFTVWSTAIFGELGEEASKAFATLSDQTLKDQLVCELPTPEALRGWAYLVRADPTRGATLISQWAKAGALNNQILIGALNALISQKAVHSWTTLAPVLAGMGPDVLSSVCSPLAQFLEMVSTIEHLEVEVVFWEIWDRLKSCAFPEIELPETEPLRIALNTSSGFLTGALMNSVSNARFEDARSIASHVWDKLTFLATGQNGSFKAARTILASRLAWFHQLNPTWVRTHLLPLLDWKLSSEACALWNGFLWQPGITPELWPEIKYPFLQTIRFASQLGEAGDEIYKLLGEIVVYRPGWLTPEEAQNSLREIDDNGRGQVAGVLRKRLESVGDQSEALWNDLVYPWLSKVWPKDAAMKGPRSSIELATAVTYAGAAFSGSVEEIVLLLSPVDYCSTLWRRLSGSGLSLNEPTATLKLLNAITDKTFPHPDDDLRRLLNEIRSSDTTVEEHAMYRRLDEYLRSHDK